MIKAHPSSMRKVICAPSYSENLIESAESILDAGYVHEKQQKASFGDLSEQYSLQSWQRFGFKVPPIIEKHKIFERGTKSTQEARLKFVYHEPNDLGFASLIVLSLELYRSLPADATTIPAPEVALNGAKWTLSEIKYLMSPGNKKLICLNW